MARCILVKDSDDTIQEVSSIVISTSTSGFTVYDLDEDTNTGDPIPTDLKDMLLGGKFTSSRVYTKPIALTTPWSDRLNVWEEALNDYMGSKTGWNSVPAAIQEKVMMGELGRVRMTDTDWDSLWSVYHPS